MPRSRASSDRRDASKHGDLSLGGADQELRCIVPEPLELIEGAGLRVEQMDHEIHEVEQHPAAAGQSFHVMGVMPLPVELLA